MTNKVSCSSDNPKKREKINPDLAPELEPETETETKTEPEPETPIWININIYFPANGKLLGIGKSAIEWTANC